MNNLNLFELMLQQRNQQDVITLEKEQEIANIHVIQMNYKDIPKTELGKKESGSIARQLNEWIKTLPDEEVDSNLIFLGIDESVEKFEDYMINKYKGKKRDEWINRFRNDLYVDAVKDIFKAKIYEHKGKNELFMNGQAHAHYQLNELLKNSRKVAHESANRLDKIMKSNGDTTYSNKELKTLITSTVEYVVSKEMKGFLPQRVNNLLN